MTRSLPEKTFEHWCSIHLNYRYRAHLQMWWPAVGADIDAVAIPGAFGKRIWLELKTVEWNPAGNRHDLSIDLRQLQAYGAGAVPDYYVFPAPPWRGVLGEPLSSRWLAGLQTPLIAYQTRSREKWFADWTWVVPGHILRDRLAAELLAARNRPTGSTLRVAEIRDGALTWLPPGLAGTRPIRWKDFWRRMETCGSSELPAQFVVPRRPFSAATIGGPSADGGPVDGASPSPVPTPRSALVSRLRSLVKDSSEFAFDIADAEMYSPVPADTYELQTLDGGTLGGGFVWDDAERALLLMEASTLTL